MVGLAAPGLAGWVCIATATSLPPLYAGRKGIQSKNIHGGTKTSLFPTLIGLIH